MSTINSPRRSLLFTPANRPALFDKAVRSGTDMICIDLEDAVAAGQKDAARNDAIAFLASATSSAPERILRINSPLSVAGEDDIQALQDTGLQQGIILIPKVEDPETVQALAEQLGGVNASLQLAVMIETIMGVENCFEILRASPRLDFAMFGGADLAAELGTAVAAEPLAYGRARLVYAARHARVDVLDMPCLNFGNQEQVRQEAERAQLLGFTGKAAIHPSNIGAINTAFTPSMDELDEALRFVEAYKNSSTGVAVVDGKLVEIPVIRTMEMILARGRSAGLIP